MEKFAFYDLETTGISPAFDQPLQFAAIVTDIELNEIERVDIRCQLSPHILPSPKALAVTGVRPSQLENNNLLNAFEFAQKIQEFTEKWAPAIWIGYNSIAFDEAMLRHMFYQNLQPNIFATQLHNNTRLDVMKMVFAVHAEEPHILKWPINAKGKVNFKLDQLAPENGFHAHNAHDALGDVEASNGFAQMAFSIEKATVTAKSRALKAEYTLELAQDLKAIHGLDAESELANILSSEILAEINREVVRNVNIQAKTGAADTASAGTFNLDVDANGRWSVEKFKGLLFQIERESNKIAKETRRGKGNFILCSSDVASALSMDGVLDYAPALNTNLNVDDTGNTFAGVLNGRVKVYIDPYAGVDYLTVGYRGSNPYDAGLFYCPYVPLQMVRAVGENTFQPKIGFKTRYGMVSNPFVGATPADGLASAGTNQYYRKFVVSNIL